MILDDKMTILVFSIIEYKVKHNEAVFITGFGTFFLKNGEIAFQASSTLKDYFNKDETWEEFICRMKKWYKESK